MSNNNQNQNSRPSYVKKSPEQSKCAEHISCLQAYQGLSRGTMYRGLVKGKTVGNDLYVAIEGKRADWKLMGKDNKNRCMIDDIVVVQQTPEHLWESKEVPECCVVRIEYSKSRLKKHYCRVLGNQEREKNLLDDIDVNQLLRYNYPLRAEPISKRVPFFIIPRQDAVPLLYEMGKESFEEKEQKEMEHRLASFRLSENEQQALRQLPPYFFQNVHIDKENYYRVMFQQWGLSTHLPIGIVDPVPVGKAGDPLIECLICLDDFDLSDHALDFSVEVKGEVERIVEESRNNHEEEVKKRTDLRHLRVMTIDPSTARDLDDAIHITQVNNNEYEIGVHIADVSHYVQYNSPIDQEAQKRCTTAYMPCRAYHMLPTELCAFLCSLNPNEDKLAYTVLFRVDKEGQLLNTSPPQFFRSVIKSVARWSYEQAQDVIDNEGRFVSETPVVCHSDKHTIEECISDVRVLDILTQKIRARRFEAGGFKLDKLKIRFQIDPLTNLPLALRQDTHSSSHELIEELMLMANILVAQRINQSPIKDYAVIRFHEGPILAKPAPLTEGGSEGNKTRMNGEEKKSEKRGGERREEGERKEGEKREKPGNGKEKYGIVTLKSIEDVGKFLAAFNVKLDITNAKTMKESFQRIFLQFGRQVCSVVETLVMQNMTPALYAIEGAPLDKKESVDNIHHYALHFDCYTHFTSPIRRYADIMVHRALTAINDLERRFSAEQLRKEGFINDDLMIPYGLDHELLVQQCNACNTKKSDSRKCQEQADLIFLALYLRGLGTPIVGLGSIIAVEDQRVRMTIPSIGGNDFKINFNSCRKENANIHNMYPKDFQIEVPFEYVLKDNVTVEIVWKGENQLITRQEVQLLHVIPILLVPTKESPFNVMVFPLPPSDNRYQEIMSKYEEDSKTLQKLQIAPYSPNVLLDEQLTE